MTAVIRVADVSLRERLHAVVEDVLPWYDHEREAERDAKTEAIRQRSIGLRRLLERRTDNYRRVRFPRR